MTNADLEKLVETKRDGFARAPASGNATVAEKGMASSHLATEAAKSLLAQTKTDAAEIDLIVLASVTAGYVFFPLRPAGAEPHWREEGLGL